MASTLDPPSRGLRLLSLDGGGIRGLSTLMILDRLMHALDRRSPPKPCEVFDLIGGTSTGGLIAIMLGRLQMSTQECIKAYLNLCKTVFSPKRSKINLIGRSYDIWSVNGRFESDALAYQIQKVITREFKAVDGFSREVEPTKDEISKLGNALLHDEGLKCKTFVCAVRERFADSACLFRTYPSPRALEMPIKIWEAARATSAATTFFDPISIGPYGARFVDGGFRHNNPVREVLNEAIDQWNGATNAIQMFVSIGTGEPHPGPIGKNAPAVLKTLKSIALQTEQTAKEFAKEHWDWKKSGKYLRFNVQKGLEAVGLEDHDKIDVIAEATDRYMEDEEIFAQVTSFAQQLARTNAPHMLVAERNLSPEQVLYLERYQREVLLEHGTSPSNPSGWTISIPTQLFTPEAHTVRVDELPADLGLRASWATVLHALQPTESQSQASDLCRQRVSVFDAAWLPGRSGLFLAHIPVSDIWRFITLQGQSAEKFEPGYNPYGVSVYIKGSHEGEPLLQLNPEPAPGTMGSANIWHVVDDEVAKCIVGRAGLHPLGICGEKYFNEQPGLEKVFLPWAVFFTEFPIRVFFRRHVHEAMAILNSLLQILYQLWDHEDAIDLYENIIPIKVLLEDYIPDLERSVGILRSEIPPLATRLHSTVHSRVSRSVCRVSQPRNMYSLKRAANNFFHSALAPEFEIEDALNVLKDLSQPNQESRNFDADYWIGFFGEDSARWLCLALTVNIVENLITECNVLSGEYDVLLEVPSGMCYVE